MAADLTPGGATAFVAMMEAVTVPPFERFYEEQREPVLVQLRRMLGRDAADDAFQETFLRALRAYPSLKHGQHLRAWALAIARNVAIDAYRRERITSADVPDLESVDEPLPYEELRRSSSAMGTTSATRTSARRSARRQRRRVRPRPPVSADYAERSSRDRLSRA